MQVISSTDVPTAEDVHESRRVRITNFCGVRGQSVPGPQIFLVDYPGKPGVAVRPHFHSVDQFQVFWKGESVGRHNIRPYFVHYADAYTSYGPIVDNGDGVTYMTVRVRPDSGPKYMPESRDQRPTGSSGRQLTVRSDAVALDGAEWLLGPFDDGLAVRIARMRAGEELTAGQPDGDGTVYLLLEGTLANPGNGATRSAITVIAAGPGEAVSGWQAAGDGAVVLGLGFPRPRT